jgi:hypothetical protein
MELMGGAACMALAGGGEPSPFTGGQAGSQRGACNGRQRGAVGNRLVGEDGCRAGRHGTGLVDGLASAARRSRQTAGY